MKTKLILVEGIPGSGKSTFAKRIADHYRNRDITVKLYNEGDYHPADLAWNACIPLEMLEQVLSRYGSLRDEIDKNIHIEDGYAVISYTKVETENAAFYEDMESYEIYNSCMPVRVFNDLIIYKRWKAFGQKAGLKDELNVFECAFLQNHITELMYFHLVDIDTMREYFYRLILTVKDLSPVLIYLFQPDVRETVRRAAEERVNPGGKWIEDLIRFSENTPYSRQYGRTGFEGALRCIEERKQAELEIIKTLPVQSIVLENKSYDWETLWQELERRLPK
jgi:hypothetical protein